MEAPQPTEVKKRSGSSNKESSINGSSKYSKMYSEQAPSSKYKSSGWGSGYRRLPAFESLNLSQHVRALAGEMRTHLDMFSEVECAVMMCLALLEAKTQLLKHDADFTVMEQQHQNDLMKSRRERPPNMSARTENVHESQRRQQQEDTPGINNRLWSSYHLAKINTR